MIFKNHERKSWLRNLYDNKIITIHADNDFEFDPDYQIEPDAINFRLHPVLSKVKMSKGHSMDLLNHQREHTKNYENIIMTPKGLKLAPRSLYLGKTLEVIAINNTRYMGLIFNRPIISKLGISIHFSQNKLPPGVCWSFPLQIFNALSIPIKIYPFMFICQMILIEYNEESHRLYTGENIFSSQINSWRKSLDNEEENQIITICDKYSKWLKKGNDPKDLGKEELVKESLNKSLKKWNLEKKKTSKISLRGLANIPNIILAPFSALLIIAYTYTTSKPNLILEIFKKPLIIWIFVVVVAYVIFKPVIKFIIKLIKNYGGKNKI